MSSRLPKPTRILSERDVKAYCKRLVNLRRWEWRSVKWAGRKHAPDNLIMAPGFPVFPEFKRPEGKARAGQLREHERMRKGGLFVVVLDTKVQVDELLLRMEPKDLEGLETIVGNGDTISKAIQDTDREIAHAAFEQIVSEGPVTRSPRIEIRNGCYFEQRNQFWTLVDAEGHTFRGVWREEDARAFATAMNTES